MTSDVAVIARRPPEQVMRLRRLGSFHQCRLSFMRILTRRMGREGWRFSRPIFDVDARGVGHAVYTAIGPQRRYSLVAFGHDLPDQDRSDRVIATAWDATFALFDGVPDRTDIQRLAGAVPLQEAGRVGPKELTLSRANRSVRLWRHVVQALAAGQQPAEAEIDRVGYLMRTTAVYGSGKFGAADRDTIANRAEMAAPFQAEMLTVYLIRAFARDMVEHLAREEGGARAVTLDPRLAERLGIGNSTGLGMAPFLINHPVLLSNWIAAREEALARVRSLPSADPNDLSMLKDLLARSRQALQTSPSDHPVQSEKLAILHRDLERLASHPLTLDPPYPWDRLWCWAEETLSEEGQEFLVSLILEPHADLVDGLAETMADSCSTGFQIDGAMPLGALRHRLKTTFGWALDLDWSDRAHSARAWYVSEEKLEPRLGERFEEPISAYEQPLAPARDAAKVHAAMQDWADSDPVAEFLLAHPEHRHTVRRAQMAEIAPYGEIRDNTIGAELMPIDMLRAKLSFFGATKFDPRSDRWVRICMYAGAPYPQALSAETADRWVYPAVSG